MLLNVQLLQQGLQCSCDGGSIDVAALEQWHRHGGLVAAAFGRWHWNCGIRVEALGWQRSAWRQLHLSVG